MSHEQHIEKDRQVSDDADKFYQLFYQAMDERREVRHSGQMAVMCGFRKCH
jgi:hypothetical protein